MFFNPRSALLLAGVVVLAALGCGGGGTDTTGAGAGGSGGSSTSSSGTGGTSSSSSSSTSASSSSGTGGGPMTDPGKPGSSFVNAGRRVKSSKFVMDFSLGQSSPVQQTVSSSKYRLRGGLIGATGAE